MIRKDIIETQIWIKKWLAGCKLTASRVSFVDQASFQVIKGNPLIRDPDPLLHPSLLLSINQQY